MRMRATLVLLLGSLLMACNPTLKIEPIKIEINATIKIVIEKEVEKIFEEEDLF